MDKKKLEILVFNSKKNLENLKNYLVELELISTANKIDEIIKNFPID